MKNLPNMKNLTSFNKLSQKFFSHGPYNPMNYKRKLVSDKKLT